MDKWLIKYLGVITMLAGANVFIQGLYLAIIGYDNIIMSSLILGIAMFLMLIALFLGSEEK